MRLILTITVALMGFDLIAGRVTDLRGVRPATISVRQAEKDPVQKGHQTCVNCRKGKIDLCEESTFHTDKTKLASVAAPKISDCEDLVKEIEGEKFDNNWFYIFGGDNVDRSKMHDIWGHKNCYIGFKTVDPDGENGTAAIAMGNQDVIDIIRDAIAKFGTKEGKVYATGEAQCNANSPDKRGANRVVSWQLYNPFG
ncbi:chitinase [Apiospora hydei]|uniref:Chitinase n=1 Tax=Apiospora hydei TaxID=1337664 RepID=A0ABR1V8P6_9PEZI